MYLIKKIFCAFFLLLIITDIYSQPVITEKPVSFGWKSNYDRTINTIIIHSTFNNSGGNFYDADLVLEQFKKYKVTSHYLIGRDGTIFRLVEEKNTAFHAGVSVLPDGSSNINSKSIGIEVITSFNEKPTDEQMKSVVALVNDICTRYQIKYILRHSDIAPGRKTDPWNFNWEEFMKLIVNNNSQN